MSLRVRAARPEDHAAIAALWNRFIEDSTVTFTTLPKGLDDIAALNPLIIAEAEQRLIGFASFGPFRGGPGYADVAEHSLYIVPEAQRSGAGRALMAALETEAHARSIGHLVGAISGSNAGAIGFHAALGFEKAGFFPGLGQKFGQRLDLVLMHKKLRDMP